MRKIYLIISSLSVYTLSFSQGILDSFSYETKSEISSKIVANFEIDSTITFEKIVVEGYKSKIPLFYYKNRKNADSEHVILLHGLGDDKEGWIYPSMPYFDYSSNLKSIKDSLLILGYSLIIPDAAFHGERTYEIDFIPAYSLPPDVSQNPDDSRLFAELMYNTTLDVRIVMDYFESLNNGEVSSFHIVGYSMGGSIGILLNSIENRISSVVACVPPIRLPGKTIENFDWSSELKIALKKVTPFNYAERQKGPILILAGNNDIYYTIEEVKSFIQKIPSDSKELKIFNAGHELPDEYTQDVINWMKKN